MHGLVFAMTLAALPSQGAANAALADYMSALAVAQPRWARIAELRVAGKHDEATSLVRPLPAVLAQDFAAFETALANAREVPPRRAGPLAWARWAHDRDQPGLAARLFQEAREAGAAVDLDQRNTWFRACLEIGDLECVARLTHEVTLTPADRGRVEALTAGTLAPPEAFEVRARYGAYASDSSTLALERWALRPRTTGDGIERLKVVARVLGRGRAGWRLANEALIADPALPPSDLVATIIDLVNHAPGPDQAFGYWGVVASDARSPETERARAFLQMGLIRQRQGRPTDAERAFGQALPLEGHDVPTAALLIGHVLLRRGEYEAALAAYRKAESLHWEAEGRIRMRCGNDDPRRRLVPYVLYQGICLEHLGRVREAMAEYASILLGAPLWWRRPLALHLIELYDAQGRLGVLQRLVDDVDGSRYAKTIPIRQLMIVRRLEKHQDWRSLVAHLEAPRNYPRIVDPRRPDDRDMASAQTAAAHALARHCDAALPLLPPTSDSRTDSQPWVAYTRALCDTEGDALRVYLRHEESELQLPELGFPPVTSVDLPDPIVCAESVAPNAPPGLRKAACP